MSQQYPSVSVGQGRQFTRKSGGERMDSLFQPWRKSAPQPELPCQPRRQIPAALGQPGREARTIVAKIAPDNITLVIRERQPGFASAFEMIAAMLAVPIAVIVSMLGALSMAVVTLSMIFICPAWTAGVGTGSSGSNAHAHEQTKGQSR